MLGADNATPAVETPTPVCALWEEMLMTGGKPSCSITPASVFYIPSRVLGVNAGSDFSFKQELASLAVWGGLAYLLFMRGR